MRERNAEAEGYFLVFQAFLLAEIPYGYPVSFLKL